MEEIVYLNGSLVPRAQAKVSVFDQGFLYGYGLFETMRAYRGTIFMMERHVARLLKSARAIGLADSLVGIDFGKTCMDTLAANRLKDARLRLTVTRGEVESFPGLGVKVNPTVLVTARAYSGLSPEVYERGFRVGIASLRQNSQSPLPGVKSTSYLLCLLAKMEAEAAGLDEALLLNERGAIAEGSTSNVFFVAPGSGLITPSLVSGILPGITREVVMELARAQGIAVSEAEVKPEALGGFREAFLTNSVMEIMPLVEVRDGSRAITIGSGKPGKMTRQLMTTYREMVESRTGPK